MQRGCSGSVAVAAIAVAMLLGGVCQAGKRIAIVLQWDDTEEVSYASDASGAADDTTVIEVVIPREAVTRSHRAPVASNCSGSHSSPARSSCSVSSSYGSSYGSCSYSSYGNCGTSSYSAPSYSTPVYYEPAPVYYSPPVYSSPYYGNPCPGGVCPVGFGMSFGAW